MGRADRSSRAMLLKAQADRFAVDLILDCERAASRRNPRHRDPTRWNKTAWRRYLYAAAHAPSLVDLGASFRTLAPNTPLSRPKSLAENRPASLWKGQRAFSFSY